MKNKGISIIGTGALGGTLAMVLAGAGFSIVSLYNHHEEKAEQIAVDTRFSETGGFPQKKSELGKIIFLTVPDRYIERIAVKLAKIDEDFTGYSIIHCSGNKSSAILESLQAKGASVASFHPIQTFTSTSTADDFKNIYIDIEGDEDALHCLRELCSTLHCHAMEINSEAKPYLHAAAVMASNYMVALIECAGQIAQIGGVNKNKARRALMPLMEKSVKNIAASDRLNEALSGPIARGDVSTVAEHIKLLKRNPRLLALYKQLSGILVDISKQDEIYSDKHANKISGLLNE